MRNKSIRTVLLTLVVGTLAALTNGCTSTHKTYIEAPSDKFFKDQGLKPKLDYDGNTETTIRIYDPIVETAKAKIQAQEEAAAREHKESAIAAIVSGKWCLAFCETKVVTDKSSECDSTCPSKQPSNHGRTGKTVVIERRSPATPPITINNNVYGGSAPAVVPAAPAPDNSSQTVATNPPADVQGQAELVRTPISELPPPPSGLCQGVGYYCPGAGYSPYNENGSLDMWDYRLGRNLNFNFQGSAYRGSGQRRVTNITNTTINNGNCNQSNGSNCDSNNGNGSHNGNNSHNGGGTTHNPRPVGGPTSCSSCTAGTGGTGGTGHSGYNGTTTASTGTTGTSTSNGALYSTRAAANSQSYQGQAQQQQTANYRQPSNNGGGASRSYRMPSGGGMRPSFGGGHQGGGGHGGGRH